MVGWSVLIADGDDDTRVVVGTFLRYRGVRVLEASSGAEAARLLAAERPDAVFYDPTFGELDQPLRADPPYTRTVVAVSASILPRPLVAELERRRIPLLQKPCLPTHVYQVLLDLLSSAQPAAPSSSSTQGATSRSEPSPPNA